MQVYKEQSIELPFGIGPPSNANASKNLEAQDMISQLSSQFSDSSRGTASNNQRQISLDALTPKDMMLQFNNTQ
jgi:hypothetical protein